MATIQRVGCWYEAGVTRPTVKSWTVCADGEFDAGDSGEAIAISWKNGNFQLLKLTDSCTVAFDPPSSGIGTFVLRIVQCKGGGHIITWPKGIKWAFGQVPQISTSDNSESMVSLRYLGPVCGWYGQAISYFSTVE